MHSFDSAESRELVSSQEMVHVIRGIRRPPLRPVWVSVRVSVLAHAINTVIVVVILDWHARQVEGKSVTIVESGVLTSKRS